MAKLSLGDHVMLRYLIATAMFAVMLAEPDEPAEEKAARSTVVWGGIALVCTFRLLVPPTNNDDTRTQDHGDLPLRY